MHENVSHFYKIVKKFDYKGQKIFFKVDYYDLNYEYMSENLADPAISNRVLTIMLADEY